MEIQEALVDKISARFFEKVLVLLNDLRIIFPECNKLPIVQEKLKNNQNRFEFRKSICQKWNTLQQKYSPMVRARNEHFFFNKHCNKFPILNNIDMSLKWSDERMTVESCDILWDYLFYFNTVSNVVGKIYDLPPSMIQLIPKVRKKMEDVITGPSDTQSPLNFLEMAKSFKQDFQGDDMMQLTAQMPQYLTLIKDIKNCGFGLKDIFGDDVPDMGSDAMDMLNGMSPMLDLVEQAMNSPNGGGSVQDLNPMMMLNMLGPMMESSGPLGDMITSMLSGGDNPLSRLAEGGGDMSRLLEGLGGGVGEIGDVANLDLNAIMGNINPETLNQMLSSCNELEFKK